MDSIIYKYVNLETLEIILKNSSLKFTKPEDFNDPFEFHENLVQKEISLIHWIEIFRKREGSISFKRLIRLYSIYRNNIDEFRNGLNDQFQERKRTSRVCCFSENFKSLLMWAHYADKHNGACVGFSKDILSSGFKGDCQVNKVKYSADIRPLSISRYRDKAILHWIMTKGKVWEYEKEVRIVLGSNPSEIINFDIKSIKKVIFGCKMDDEQKQAFERLIFSEMRYHWIVTSEMKVSDHRFQLEECNRQPFAEN